MMYLAIKYVTKSAQALLMVAGLQIYGWHAYGCGWLQYPWLWRPSILRLKAVRGTALAPCSNFLEIPSIQRDEVTSSLSKL